MIAITAPLVASIAAACAQAYPHEACGALLGRFLDAAGPPRRQVVGILPIDNAREVVEQYHRFRIADADYLAAEQYAEARGLDIVGFYHSHPDHPAVPSDYDRDHALPGLSYVVVAVSATGTPGPRAVRATSWELARDRTRFVQEAELDWPAPDPHRPPAPPISHPTDSPQETPWPTS
jgi:proteasome lid subunit RPN8/RPN11